MDTVTAGQWFVVGLFVVVVAFIVWVWAMSRIDEHAERRQAEQMRRSEPPVLGGAPCHRRARHWRS